MSHAERPRAKAGNIAPGLERIRRRLSAVENLKPIAGWVIEHDEILHAPLVGQRARAARHVGTRSLQPGGERIAELMAFYQDVLEFKLSDYWLRPFPGYFFHVNPRHHSIAFVESGINMVHHMMVELYSFDDVGQGYDLALGEPGRIAVTLGRHSGDYVTSFYTQNPSGFLVEYGWGGQLIDDSTWKPFERKFGPSLWGHERRWMSAEKKEESRQLCIEAAENGQRQPVQVIEGNYRLMPGVCPWWDSMKQGRRAV